MTSLSDKEWLTPGDIARVLGWSKDRVRDALKKGQTFSRTRISVDGHDRVRFEVHRDEIIEFAAKHKGGRHGRH